MTLPEFLLTKNYQDHLSIVEASYKHCFSESLFDVEYQDEALVEKVWNAKFALVSHGAQEDPIFNFANQAALDLFDMDFDTFTRTPSRQSAENEKLTQEERNALLKEVTEKGCIDNYSGVRISAKGRRFFVKNARVWNLIDSNGSHVGQAAILTEWELID
jgi:hypothetical protein